MKSGLKKVPIHLQSAQNRLIIKNGTVVNSEGEQQVDVYMEVRLREQRMFDVKLSEDFRETETVMSVVLCSLYL